MQLVYPSQLDLPPAPLPGYVQSGLHLFLKLRSHCRTSNNSSTPTPAPQCSQLPKRWAGLKRSGKWVSSGTGLQPHSQKSTETQKVNPELLPRRFPVLQTFLKNSIAGPVTKAARVPRTERHCPEISSPFILRLCSVYQPPRPRHPL